MINCLKEVRLLVIGARVWLLGMALLGPVQLNAQTPDPSDSTYVRFSTTLGNIDVLLLTHEAPLNVDNFMRYVNSNSYNNTFFHRAIPGFIIQGGGYFWNTSTNPAQINAVTANAAVQGEPGISNQRGTLALALSNGPNSGTTNWFFNLADNSSALDGTIDGGPFTVFGVVANASSLAVMDAIANTPTYNFGDPFATLPLMNYNTADSNLPLSDFIYLNSITTLTTTNFTAWQSAFSGDPNAATDSLPAATPQNDGATNLLKYFCGITANASMSAANRAKLPVGGKTTVSGTTYQTLTYHQRPNMVGVFATVQVSTDLQTWSTATTATTTQTGTDPDGDSIMQVQLAIPAGGRQFVRLSLSQ